MLVPVGEGALERGIAPALRDPRRVAEDAQRAQRLDQAQGRAIEVAHLLVAVDEQAALALRLVVAAGREQPQVLHRRAVAEVVEVEEEEAAAAGEQVAQVAVAVDAVSSPAAGQARAQASTMARPAAAKRARSSGGTKLARIVALAEEHAQARLAVGLRDRAAAAPAPAARRRRVCRRATRRPSWRSESSSSSSGARPRALAKAAK